MKAFSIFLAVFLAIALAVLVFAPERLPSGIGVTPTPIEVTQRPSFFGQGQVAMFRNPTATTLYKVKIVLIDAKGNFVKAGERETWPPGETLQLGWLEGWQIQAGSVVRISAAGHYARSWEY